MGYKFKDTLRATMMATELDPKWALTYEGKLVITRVNAQFIEDLQFFNELSKHFCRPFDQLVEDFIQHRESLLNDACGKDKVWG